MSVSVSPCVKSLLLIAAVSSITVPVAAHAQAASASATAPPAETLEPREDYLHAAADRVELRLESNGMRERVGVSATPAGGDLGSGRGLGDEELHWMLCETPCSIWVHPGVTHLVVRGDAVTSFVTDQPVLAGQPMRIHLRARPRSLANMETAFVASGLTLALYGGIFTALTFPALQTSNPTLPIIGITSLGVAAGFIVAALIVHSQGPTGISSSEAISPAVVGDWRPSHPGALPVWVPARSM